MKGLQAAKKRRKGAVKKVENSCAETAECSRKPLFPKVQARLFSQSLLPGNAAGLFRLRGAVFDEDTGHVYTIEGASGITGYQSGLERNLEA